MSTTLLLGSALIPAFFLLWYLCSRDANPEPPGVVIKTFLLGALVTVPIVPLAWGLEALGGNAMGMWPKALVGAFLGAAIPEELFKFAVLRFWVWKQKDFDEPMDGIVYGAAASLGFAALENVMYVSEGGFGVATLRAVTAVPGHALTGVLMGYFAGRAKFAPEGERAGLLLRGLGAAMLTHGLYDAFLLTESGWAAGALPVLFWQLTWARKLIAEMRVEQLAAPAPAALQPGAPAPDGLAVQPSPRVERVLPPQRTAWALAKIVLGALGASACALFLIGCAFAAADPAADAGLKIGLAVVAVAGALATAGCLLVFRSGIRGPFVEPVPAMPAAPAA